jgi:hypothetical protein
MPVTPMFKTWGGVRPAPGGLSALQLVQRPVGLALYRVDSYLESFEGTLPST